MRRRLAGGCRLPPIDVLYFTDGWAFVRRSRRNPAGHRLLLSSLTWERNAGQSGWQQQKKKKKPTSSAATVGARASGGRRQALARPSLVFVCCCRAVPFGAPATHPQATIKFWCQSRSIAMVGPKLKATPLELCRY